MEQTAMQRPGAVVYADASALVKRYLVEPGTDMVNAAMDQATLTATSLAALAEVASVLARGIRGGRLTRDAAAAALADFRGDLVAFYRVTLSEATATRAMDLAWRFGLRGFDAMHLASALVAEETLGGELVFATFDRELWWAARELGLVTVPDDLDTFLALPGSPGRS